MAKRRPAKTASAIETWQTAETPGPMLHAARERLTPRQLRLFAVACCRDLWGTRNPAYVEVARLAEFLADGGTDPQQVAALRSRAYPHGVISLVHDNAETAATAWAQMVSLAPRHAARHAHFLRDIGGNPFDEIKLAPALLAWRDGTIQLLAQALYDENDFDRIGVLGDAFEEAGCRDTAILDHLRGSLEHCRGCWVVDLALGTRKYDQFIHT